MYFTQKFIHDKKFIPQVQTFKRPLSTSQNKFDMPYKPLCELSLPVHADRTLSLLSAVSIQMRKKNIKKKSLSYSFLYIVAWEAGKVLNISSFQHATLLHAPTPNCSCEAGSHIDLLWPPACQPGLLGCFLFLKQLHNCIRCAMAWFGYKFDI